LCTICRFFRRLLLGEDDREITREQGEKAAKEAEELAKEHQKDKTTYQSPPKDENTDDCSHFCHTAYQNAGIDVSYHWTARFAESKEFVEVSADDARAGDVIYQPRDGGGHVGILTGTTDKKGRIQAWQMGNSGARLGAWGPGGWFAGGDKAKFYRPLKQ